MAKWTKHIGLGAALLTALAACAAAPPAPSGPAAPNPGSEQAARPAPPLQQTFFEESWQRYRQRFIQADGRVIDWETDDQRTTSEGQAYAMLRAVFIDDPETFERVLRWGENNLARRGSNGQLTDQLWAWKWGPGAATPSSASSWGITDANFASDADIDAILALIFAARRWQREDYMQLAEQKLTDLWTYSTVELSGKAAGRYLLPGPAAAFQPSATTLDLNPSYLAPYAFRLFAQVDPERDWLSLVDSSYRVLNASAAVSTVGLPSNWVRLNGTTGNYEPVPASGQLRSLYGFDAYRVWWRVALDAAWFDAPEAHQYLQRHLPVLVERWQQQQTLPAEIGLDGQTVNAYESTAQYAMLYAALTQAEAASNPESGPGPDPDFAAVATALREQKLMPAYRDGFWDSASAYYTQNLAWLGLYPPEWVSADWRRPSS